MIEPETAESNSGGDSSDSDDFDIESTQSTVGVDFKYKIFDLDFSQVKVCLKFFDTSGSPFYRDICLSYLFCVQAYLILYDVNNLSSFMNCQTWLDEISKPKYKAFFDTEGNENSDGLIKILVGCKNDLKEQKAVSTKKARDFARKNGFLLFFETSAKDNTNIKELFDEVCLELIANYLNYLNSKLARLSLYLDCSEFDRCVAFNSMSPLSALSTKSNVFFDCKSESLNCGHIILNNLNSRRKNLRSKSFFMSDIFTFL